MFGALLGTLAKFRCVRSAAVMGMRRCCVRREALCAGSVLVLRGERKAGCACGVLLFEQVEQCHVQAHAQAQCHVQAMSEHVRVKRGGMHAYAVRCWMPLPLPRGASIWCFDKVP